MTLFDIISIVKEIACFLVKIYLLDVKDTRKVHYKLMRKIRNRKR